MFAGFEAFTLVTDLLSTPQENPEQLVMFSCCPPLADGIVAVGMVMS